MADIRRTTWNNRLGSNGPVRAYRTHCKLGKHAVYDGDLTVWLTNPMGLSCQPCADELRAELTANG